MTDFESAFKRGQEAANQARAAKAEIDEIFHELNRQISRVSNGGLEIRRTPRERPSSGNRFQLGLLFGGTESYTAIEARATGAGIEKTIVLGEWKEDASGYPCMIKGPGENRRCHDRDSLEDGLSALLEHPTTGNRLARLMAAISQAVAPDDEEE